MGLKGQERNQEARRFNPNHKALTTVVQGYSGQKTIHMCACICLYIYIYIHIHIYITEFLSHVEPEVGSVLSCQACKISAKDVQAGIPAHEYRD